MKGFDNWLGSRRSWCQSGILVLRGHRSWGSFHFGQFCFKFKNAVGWKDQVYMICGEERLDVLAWVASLVGKLVPAWAGTMCSKPVEVYVPRFELLDQFGDEDGGADRVEGKNIDFTTMSQSTNPCIHVL